MSNRNNIDDTRIANRAKLGSDFNSEQLLSKREFLRYLSFKCIAIFAVTIILLGLPLYGSNLITKGVLEISLALGLVIIGGLLLLSCLIGMIWAGLQVHAQRMQLLGAARFVFVDMPLIIIACLFISTGIYVFKIVLEVE